jgi:hypothetical protein
MDPSPGKKRRDSGLQKKARILKLRLEAGYMFRQPLTSVMTCHLG